MERESEESNMTIYSERCAMLNLSVMSDSLWPHGLQPARLLYPWTFPGKNTRVGCHFLPQVPANWIPAWVSFSPAFCTMSSAWKLEKQGDNMQPWYTPFPAWNQFIAPCPVLTAASRLAYGFLRRKARQSHILLSVNNFHSLLWST